MEIDNKIKVVFITDNVTSILQIFYKAIASRDSNSFCGSVLSELKTFQKEFIILDAIKNIHDLQKRSKYQH